MMQMRFQDQVQKEPVKRSHVGTKQTFVEYQETLAAVRAK